MSQEHQDCEHGVPRWRKTRTGEPSCALCRHAARAAARTQARRPRPQQPVLDIAMLRAGDDSAEDLGTVVPIAAARRARERRRRDTW